MPAKSSMKSGIVASMTAGLLTRYTDEMWMDIGVEDIDDLYSMCNDDLEWSVQQYTRDIA